eukprot:SAG31_NODE_91_length_26366_cov_6.792211_14_plen_428_part_00
MQPVDTNDQLVDYLCDRGAIVSKRVELAFRRVDRALFVTEDLSEAVYIDRPFGKSIGGDAKIHHSAPHIYATCLEKLQVHPGHSVLNVGSGTGYLSTMLAFLAGPQGAIHGVEVYAELVQHADLCLQKFNSVPLPEEKADASACPPAEEDSDDEYKPAFDDGRLPRAEDGTDTHVPDVLQLDPQEPLLCELQRTNPGCDTPRACFYAVISADAQILGLLSDEGPARHICALWPGSTVQPMQVDTYLRPASYLKMISAKPSPDVAADLVQDWAIAEHIGFAPPTPLQMAQRCLAFSISQLNNPHDGMSTLGWTAALLPTDISDSIGQLLSSMQFPRASGEVTFAVGNALTLDSRKCPARYDRIYVAAQGEREDLMRLRGFLKPGGILIGPFDSQLLKVTCETLGSGMGAHISAAKHTQQLLPCQACYR